LRISATDNCGVLIYISSNKVGSGNDWQAGPWRNDELLGIFSNYAAEPRPTPRRSG
jgi:hypothetical protein